MIKPFKGNYRLTQIWGANPKIYSKFGLLGHNGIDWGLPNGTEVIAPHAGKVIEKAYDKNGYGNYLKIENTKEGSILSHFQKFFVNVGDTIKQGQKIALSNNTGFSTGPHIHWGYYKKPRDRSNGYSGTMNQLPLLKENNMNLQKQYDDCRFDRDSHWTELKAAELDLDKAIDKILEFETKIKELEKEFELANKKINKLIEANGILENKAKTDLDKAKLDYEKLLADEKLAFKGELESIEDQHRNDLLDLEEKYKDVDLPKPEPKPKGFFNKLGKAWEIMFG